MELPVVDFSSVLTSKGVTGSQQVIDQLHEAFVDIGFVFIKNHGIDQQKIDASFCVAEQFFQQPPEAKLPFKRTNSTTNSGYICLEQERLDPSIPADLKEAYNITMGATQVWPDVNFPFKQTAGELFLSCERFALKLLECMGTALGLEDPLFFVSTHEDIKDATKNVTTLRLLYYPGLDTGQSVKAGQLRCGEHVDYGSITLLFQSSIGGLQVKRSNGEYIDVPYVPGTVLVNLGALMQRWTADKYLATPHRVLIPKDECTKRRVRQSIAFFLQPSNDCVIRCIDGSDKYPPITAEQFIAEKFSKTYT